MALDAGRALDALVEQHVVKGPYNTPEALPFCPEYSLDIAAAWAVVEKLKDRFRDVEFSFPDPNGRGACAGQVLCQLVGGPMSDDPNHVYEMHEAWAATAPLAICLAALRACGVSGVSGVSGVRDGMGLLALAPLAILGVVAGMFFLMMQSITTPSEADKRIDAMYEHCIRDGHPDYECYRDTHPGAR